MTSWFVDSRCSLLTNSWRWSFPFKRSLYFSGFSQAATKRGFGQYQNHISPSVIFRDFRQSPLNWNLSIHLSINLMPICHGALTEAHRHKPIGIQHFVFPLGCLVFFRCWQAFMASPPWSLPSTNGTRQGVFVLNTWGIRLGYVYIYMCVYHHVPTIWTVYFNLYLY